MDRPSLENPRQGRLVVHDEVDGLGRFNGRLECHDPAETVAKEYDGLARRFTIDQGEQVADVVLEVHWPEVPRALVPPSVVRQNVKASDST